MNKKINPEMWTRYANDNESIAIRTTFSKLSDVLPCYVEIGMVRYIDYRTERLPTLNMLEYITHKNIQFESEQEIRAVAMHSIVEGLDREHFQTHHFEGEDDPELRVFAPPVPLQEFVDAVFVHPKAPEGFFENVRSLCEQNNIASPERAEW